MVEQRPFRVVETKNPRLAFGLQTWNHEPCRARHQQLPRIQILNRRRYFRQVQLGHAELTGGDIEVRQTSTRAFKRNGRQVTILMRTQQAGLGDRARRDDPCHFAPHQFFAWARFLHLLAERDPEAFLNQPRDVAFGGVIRHTAHGNGLIFFLVAGR